MRAKIMKTLNEIRDFVVGPPPAKVGSRLPVDVRQSFERVDREANMLHALARRMQRLDELENQRELKDGRL